MIYAIIFILGLLIGSFMNVCIYRIPRGESIYYPPSHCTYCGKRIKPYDMIPIVSFIFLLGKCRYCKKKISPVYPALELTNAALYVSLYYIYGLNMEFFKYAVFVSISIVIGFIDYRTENVYLNTILFGTVSGILFLIYDAINYMNITTYIYGAALGASILIVIIILTHAMGTGDAEICFLCGLFCGVKLTLFILFLSFIIGGTAGVLLVTAKKKKRTDYIPFGPSIAAASIISVIAGKRIIMWYMLKLVT